MSTKVKKNDFFRKLSSIFFIVAIIAAFFIYGSDLFLNISWLASLGSSRNMGVILFRVGIIPVFSFVFACSAIVHSWLGSYRERHNKKFLTFKFFFFFICIAIIESFLRIGESTIYAILAGPTGIKDSLFSIDLSWYLFWMPLIRKISLFFMGYFALLFIFRVSYPGNQKKIAYGKFSLALFGLFSILYLLIEYGQYLSQQHAIETTTFIGYSDLYGHFLPLVFSLLWTWLFFALSLYFFRRNYRVLFGGGVFTFIVLVGCNLIWPFYLDKFIFNPNKTFYQNKFAGIHAENTRSAFGLVNIQKITNQFTPKSISDVSITNGFLLDKDIFLKQLQNNQDFHSSLGFDRVNASIIEKKPAFISARLLKNPAEDWEQQYFRDIYGYGAVIASASQVGSNGEPSYLMQGLHPSGKISLKHPEIFFAENFDDYAFINTKIAVPNYKNEGAGVIQQEFENIHSMPVSFFHKVALAWKKRDIRTLITKNYTPQTRLIYYRKPSELVKKLLPYFDYSEPKLRYDKNNLWWELDGYSSSEDLFVASSVNTPWGKKNWLRAPIRAYVNAYSGEVIFRRIDIEDPFVRVISKVFPQLFKESIDLQDASYPEELFKIQAKLMERYHEMNPDSFYSGLSERMTTPEVKAQPIVLLSASSNKVLGYTQDYTLKNQNSFNAQLIAYIDRGHPSLLLFEPSFQNSIDPVQALTALQGSEDFKNIEAYWQTIDIKSTLGQISTFPYSEGVFYIQPIYTNSITMNMPVLAKAALIKNTGIHIGDSFIDLAVYQGSVEETEESLSREEQLQRIIQQAYSLYLQAEQARIQGKTQDYRQNVERIGDRLREASR
ncbi:MAG: UPF0182 family protein [Brevinema sp.]